MAKVTILPRRIVKLIILPPIMHALLILMLERIFAITVPTFNFGKDYGYKIPTKPRKELNTGKLKQDISSVILIFV